jgi:hypothetical protein
MANKLQITAASRMRNIRSPLIFLLENISKTRLPCPDFPHPGRVAGMRIVSLSPSV